MAPHMPVRVVYELRTSHVVHCIVISTVEEGMGSDCLYGVEPRIVAGVCPKHAEKVFWNVFACFLRTHQFRSSCFEATLRTFHLCFQLRVASHACFQSGPFAGFPPIEVFIQGQHRSVSDVVYPATTPPRSLDLYRYI